jgi:hypothetical protein
MTLIGDTTVVIKSVNLRVALTPAWRGCNQHGGPLVVTVNDVPEFAIYPLRVFVPLVHEQTVREFARNLYEPLVPGQEHPPKGYEAFMPCVGPNALRRNFAGVCRKMRAMLTPYLYTNYHQGVAVLFPIPYNEGMVFVRKLNRLWYPQRYETAEAEQEQAA